MLRLTDSCCSVEMLGGERGRLNLVGAQGERHSTKTSQCLNGPSRESCGKMGRMKVCSDDLIIGSRDSRGWQWSLMFSMSTSPSAAGTGSNISIIIIPELVQLIPLISFFLFHCRFSVPLHVPASGLSVLLRKDTG